MTKKEVANSLKTALADSYSLYLKTHNYHWNVQGPNFKSLHDLFELQYTDLAVAVDDIAERIRTLGEKAPGTFKAYQAISTIEDGDESFSAEMMVKDLASDQYKINLSLKKAFDVAQKIGDEVTVGLMVERMTIHEKNAWMLESNI